MRSSGSVPASAEPAEPFSLPRVAVQLPVYRESAVLERLLRSVVALDYPSELLTVQVLDDSDGAEAERCRTIVAAYCDHPVRVEYLNRGDRSGFKAGALNYGLARTDAQLFAVFDADFEPDTDFLRTLVPAFRNEKVGAIQARWRYSNAGESPLTQLQAGIFDKMFCFEEDVRSRFGRPAIFLGTNGVWRKKTIESVGGWVGEPFTSEDIDLSYRAHVAGWKILYEPRAIATSELPNNYLAYLGQQRRWARGVTRVFLDHFRTMMAQRARRQMELLESSLLVFQVGMPFTVFLPILLMLYMGIGLDRSSVWIGSQLVLTVSLVAAPIVAELVISQVLLYADWRSKVLGIFKSLPATVGLMVALFFGVVETLVSSSAEFVKTPKQGELGTIQNSVKKYLHGAVPVMLGAWVQVAICLAGVVLALWKGYWESTVLLLSMGMGYLVSAQMMRSELRYRSRLASQLS
jgi:cellulose synthase/poly-beta-1,6-N-acetylglucosamine synthase-like glycosyltransferase